MSDELPNRRTVLKSIGTASLVGVSTASASASEAVNNVEIIEIRNDEKSRVISKATRSNEFQLIKGELLERGYNYSDADIDVGKVIKEDRERYVMQVPFKEDDKETVFIQYNGLDDVSVRDELEQIPNFQGFVIDQGRGLGTHSLSSDEMYSESLIVTNGRIKSTSEIYDRSASPSEVRTSGKNDEMRSTGIVRPVPGPGDPGCDTCMRQAESNCEDVNWRCVAVAISAGIAAGGACASCAASLGMNPTCGLCLNALFGAGISIPWCDMGGGCETICECVPEDLNDEYNTCQETSGGSC